MRITIFTIGGRGDTQPFLALALRLMQAGTPRRLAGLVAAGRRVPRPGYPILCEDDLVGEVVSGTASPTREKCIATGYIRADVPRQSDSLRVDIRGRLESVREVSLPFCQGHGDEAPSR